VAELAVARQTEFVERHKVRAPFAGVIIAKNAQAGEILSPAAGGGEFTRTGVATLVDMASLEVEVDVNEGQIADVRAGQAATVVLDAYTDWEIPGEVIAIIPTANRDRATIQVRVGFKVRDPRILPQMAAKVTFDRSAE
jgi:multidrug resistance efflux pump